MLNIWDLQKTPQPIIPLVVYHGTRNWQSRDFSDYFPDLKSHHLELARFIPRFDYLLIDLRKASDEEIRQMSDLITLEVGLLLMKKIFSPDLLEELRDIFVPLQYLMQSESGRSFYRLLLLYLLKGSNEDKQKVMEKIKEVSQEAGSEALSVAEQFIQEGIELGMKKGEEKGMQKGMQKGLIKGKKEGRIEGKVEIIQQMLSLEKFSLSEIAQFTNTSLAFVKQVQKEMKQS